VRGVGGSGEIAGAGLMSGLVAVVAKIAARPIASVVPDATFDGLTHGSTSPAATLVQERQPVGGAWPSP